MVLPEFIGHWFIDLWMWYGFRILGYDAITLHLNKKDDSVKAITFSHKKA